MSASSSIPSTGQNTVLLRLAPLFFVSGAIALIYEVVWFRQLHLVLGVSVFAVGAVVSAFMLGLAFGSFWAAERALLAWRRQPLRFYALLETGIGVWALLFPFILRGLEALYKQLFTLMGEHAIPLAIARFIVASMILVPPTFLMGATLPALTRAIASKTSRAVSGASWLYALNTAGAVAGTVFAGFFALEHLGISGTLRLALVLNFLLAIAAWALSLWMKESETVLSATEIAEMSERSPDPSAHPHDGGALRQKNASSSALRDRTALQSFAYLVVGISGFVSMAGQLVWTRALLFYVNNSSYAFSAVLTVYLTGLAVGAAAGALVAARRELALRLLPWVLVAQTAASLVAILVYRNALALARPFLAQSLPEGVTGLSGGFDVWAVDSWSSALASIFAQAGGVLILPSLIFGFTFPIVLTVAEARNDSASTPRTTGRLYAANTAGAVLGTVVGTFALVPLLGTPGSLLLLAILPTILALAAWHLRERRLARTLSRALLAAIVLLPLGRVVAPFDFYRQMFHDRFGDVVWFHEGVSETIAICERTDGTPWIQYSDGRGASGSVSWKGGWLYAHLPLLLHPDPESCVIICFGTGNTLGAASRHELARLDGVELSTGIIHAASIFRETNHDVGMNPDVNMIIDDGRNYLLGTSETYDVISEEPPLIHTAGVVNLYTRDFYELCLDRLTPDGIVAVWLPTWSMEELEVQMLVRAFLDVFPEATAWESLHPNEWILIGTRDELQVDVSRLRERMAKPGVVDDLRKLGLETPEKLLSLYLTGPDYLRRFCGDAPPVTDDKSVVDFTMPRQARSNFSLAGEVDRNVRMAGVSGDGLLTDTRVRDFEKIYVWRDRASSLVTNRIGESSDSLLAEIDRLQNERAQQAASRITYNICALAQDYYSSGQAARAFELLTKNVETYPRPANADIFATRSFLLLREGRTSEAERDLASALAIDPDNGIARSLLSQIQGSIGR